MPARRRALILVMAILAAPGCRAMNLTGGKPPLVPEVPNVGVETLIDRHNRNAESLVSFQAEPSIRNTRIGSGRGRMELVRPRDFKMTVAKPVTGDMIADIGSNNREFWIWSAESPEKELYVGQYNNAGHAPPGLLVQPDWVIEALGLQIISDAEARDITPEAGTDPSTITLVHHRPNGLGGNTVKKTLVDRTSGLIREHVFYGPDGKEILARAWPSDYRTVRAPDGSSVFLPDQLRIMATPPGDEPLELRITMGLDTVKINQFDEARRSIFNVPSYEGYAVVDLNREFAPEATAGNSRFDYETRPTPPAGSTIDDVLPAAGTGVQLGEPIPLGVEGQNLKPGDPRPRLRDDLRNTPGGIDAIVGQRIPRPPGYAEPIRAAEFARLGFTDRVSQ